MIRKLVLPVLAAALLAGCVTDYGAYGVGVQGRYYGNPSVELRYDSGYLMYPYGYGGYGTYGYPYRYYGAPYGYRGYGGYGGYYGYPYSRPYQPYYRPHHGHRPTGLYPRPHGPYPPQHRRDGDGRPPWRNLDGMRRQHSPNGGPAIAPQAQVVPAGPGASELRARGSRMEQTIRRANHAADPRPAESEP